MSWVLESKHLYDNEWRHLANPVTSNEIEDLVRYYRDVAWRSTFLTHRIRNWQTNEVIPMELFVDA